MINSVTKMKLTKKRTMTTMTILLKDCSTYTISWRLATLVLHLLRKINVEAFKVQTIVLIRSLSTAPKLKLTKN